MRGGTKELATRGYGSLGKLVRERRIALGLTQGQLAARVGGSWHQAHISRLERGEYVLPEPARLRALALAIGEPPETLWKISGWAKATSIMVEESIPPDADWSTERRDLVKIVADLNDA